MAPDFAVNRPTIVSQSPTTCLAVTTKGTTIPGLPGTGYPARKAVPRGSCPCSGNRKMTALVKKRTRVAISVYLRIRCLRAGDYFRVSISDELRCVVLVDKLDRSLLESMKFASSGLSPGGRNTPYANAHVQTAVTHQSPSSGEPYHGIEKPSGFHFPQCLAQFLSMVRDVFNDTAGIGLCFRFRSESD